MGKRRGKCRPVPYYRTPEGRKVFGLKQHPDGRFYAAEEPSKTFGTDPTRAIFRFRQWQDQNSGEKFTFETPVPWSVLHDDDAFGQVIDPDPEIKLIVDQEGNISKLSEVDTDVAFRRFGDYIRQNPPLAAQKLGIEQIAYLHDLKPPVASTTLHEIGEKYLANLQGEDVRKFRLHWQEFCGGERRRWRGSSVDLPSLGVVVS